MERRRNDLMNHPRPIATRAMSALFVLSVTAVAACSASTASGAPSLTLPVVTAPSVVPPSATPSAEPTSTVADTASPAAVVEATPVPTAIDPCALVTPAEVTQLTGASFGAGQSSTLPNHDNLCAYGQDGIIFQVLVAVEPDAATAKAGEPAFKADLESAASQAGIKDLKLTELPDFEPGVDAAVLNGSVSAGGQKVSGLSFYALKGAVIVAISEIAIGGTIPTDAAIEAQGMTTLGRLP
jgi:hypothetical protein